MGAHQYACCGVEMADDQQFCLRWNNFQANITSQFETLRDDEDFTDVTIACEGQRLQAHKVVLSACSPFFKELFKVSPILWISNIITYNCDAVTLLSNVRESYLRIRGRQNKGILETSIYKNKNQVKIRNKSFFFAS